VTVNGTVWQNRIVGYGEEDPAQLVANPRNVRIHPREQQDALSGVLESVGVVQNVLVNQSTNTLVDGHMRVMLAMRAGQPTIPVTYVNLTPQEEALILASFDPISAMAATDDELLAELLAEIDTDNLAVRAFLSDLAEDRGIDAPEFTLSNLQDRGDFDKKPLTTCPQCGHAF